jgi:predicted nucleotidyltransferase
MAPMTVPLRTDRIQTMSMTSEIQSGQIPGQIDQLLQRLVETARSSFGGDLTSIVLFGSAAEGRLRPTSDLNLLIVLKRFERSSVDSFREPLRLARVAARAATMFILETELAAAAEAFAVKFDDIARRHRILYGENVITRLTAPRAIRKRQVGQVLMNLSLRLRERYATHSLREEQLAVVIAEATGPLRAAAATVCDLEGIAINSPREALEKMGTLLGGAEWGKVLESIAMARQTGALPAGTAAGALFELIRLAEQMRARAERVD